MSGTGTAKLNLDGAHLLIVDSDRFSVEILGQILRGLGLNDQTIAETGEQAQLLLAVHIYDLCIIEARLSDMAGTDLVRWLRRLEGNQMRFAPVIMLTGHTQPRNVHIARDCGAHTVVKKPASPQVLFDHIAWAAKPVRPFVETGGYVGPDRRFKFTGPPDGVGRRATDLSAEIGKAVDPNMSQDEIDLFMKPTKIAAV